MLTPGYMRRMRLGQYRERELLSRRWLLWTALGFFAAAGILIFASGCKTCASLAQAVTIAETIGADAVAAALKDYTAAGCPLPVPTPTPTAPPVTQPTPDPTSTPTAPPTPAAGCVLSGSPSTPLPQHRSTLGSVVNAVLLELHPECDFAGGTCVINEETQQGLQRKVEEKLRARGICAGQHEPWTDEIAVARVATDPWEGYRVFSGDDTEGPLPPGAPRRTIQWAPADGSLERPDGKGGYRAAWVPPSQQPTPEPTALSACPEPRPESYRNPATKQDCTYAWGLKVGRQWVDATLTVQRCCAFCAAIGMGDYGGQMRCQCPLRPEGNAERFACEAEVGAIWKAKGGTLVVNPDNQAQANCEGAGCQVQVCTKSGVCSEWAP